MEKKKIRQKKKTSFEYQYREVVKTPLFLFTQQETLEQPHAYKFIDSVTTYGAYQKPI